MSDSIFLSELPELDVLVKTDVYLNKRLSGFDYKVTYETLQNFIAGKSYIVNANATINVSSDETFGDITIVSIATSAIDVTISGVQDNAKILKVATISADVNLTLTGFAVAQVINTDSTKEFVSNGTLYLEMPSFAVSSGVDYTNKTLFKGDEVTGATTNPKDLCPLEKGQGYLVTFGEGAAATTLYVLTKWINPKKVIQLWEFNSGNMPSDVYMYLMCYCPIDTNKMAAVLYQYTGSPGAVQGLCTLEVTESGGTYSISIVDTILPLDTSFSICTLDSYKVVLRTSVTTVSVYSSNGTAWSKIGNDYTDLETGSPSPSMVLQSLDTNLVVLWSIPAGHSAHFVSVLSWDGTDLNLITRVMGSVSDNSAKIFTYDKDKILVIEYSTSWSTQRVWLMQYKNGSLITLLDKWIPQDADFSTYAGIGGYTYLVDTSYNMYKMDLVDDFVSNDITIVE